MIRSFERVVKFEAKKRLPSPVLKLHHVSIEVIARLDFANETEDVLKLLGKQADNANNVSLFESGVLEIGHVEILTYPVQSCAQSLAAMAKDTLASL
jgi:hypothetical protein